MPAAPSVHSHSGSLHAMAAAENGTANASRSSNYPYSESPSRSQYSSVALGTSSADSRATAAGAPGGRRRKVVCATTVDDSDEVSKFYGEGEDENNPYKYTKCMNEHIVARMEDDLRRAEIRRANPDSAMPDRGDTFDREVGAALESRVPQARSRSVNRSITSTPRAAAKPTTAYFLPPLSPQTPNERSRLRSRQSSTNTTPVSQKGSGRTPSSRRSPGLNNSPSSYSHSSKQTSADETRAPPRTVKAGAVEDETAAFIRREKERDLQRRLHKSQDADHLPSVDLRASGQRDGQLYSAENLRSSGASDARRTSPRQQLVYDSYDSVNVGDAAEEDSGGRYSGAKPANGKGPSGRSRKGGR